MAGALALGGWFFSSYQKAEERIPAIFSKLDSIESKKTEIFAKDGKTRLYVATGEYRRLITDYNEIPELVINATLAAEDKRFFEHDGVDPIAVARSIVTNVQAGDARQGGSTITMQLSKRLFTSSEQSMQRKIDDAALAIQMERLLTKKEILRAYLNQVYYGQGAFGFKAAAEVYFGKAMSDLTVSEAALLARLVRRPSDQNPFVNPKAATTNRNVVLKIMLDENMISQSEYNAAKAEVPKFKKKTFAGGEHVVRYPYFTRYVLDWLKQEMPHLDLKNGGYRIETTIDPAMQEVLDQECKRLVKRMSGSGVKTAGFALLQSDGRVLALQGGVDYERNQFNVGYQGGRQPGSSMKPYVYAAALSTGRLSPTDYISNEPFKWGKWEPKNSGGGSGGSSSIQDALAYSRNIPAARVMQMVGPDVAADYCRVIFGIKSRIRPFPSMVLGTEEVTLLDMATGYSVFQLKGDRFTPLPVTRVIGPDNSIVKVWSPEISQRQLDPSVASLMDKYLRYVVTNGTGREAQAVADARGKTGTTQENKDAWFCGYTNNLMGIGWIANEQRDGNRWVYKRMGSHVMGGTVTVDLWRNIMVKAQKKYGRGSDKDVTPLNADIPLEVESRRSETQERNEQREARQQDEPVVPETKNTEPTRRDPVADPTPEPTRETTPVGEEPDMIIVDICAESGMRATPYCPDTNSRAFTKKRVPRTCTRHKEP